jgi:hypothetical protein
MPVKREQPDRREHRGLQGPLVRKALLVMPVLPALPDHKGFKA